MRHMRFPAILLLLVSAVVWPLAAQREGTSHRQVEVLISGGTVIDGTGARGRAADVGISGERIVFIGDVKSAGIQAQRVVNASGMVVAPGYIDPHTHPVSGTPEKPANLNFLMQGVTTIVFGNDGGGPTNIAEVLARWEKQGTATNIALLVGHGTVRREVLGNEDVQPTPAQLEQMKAKVRQAMAEGAFGLSSGLYYVPGNFAKTEEVIELARVATEFGGVYDSHLRDESSYNIGLLAAVEEALRIGKEARIAVNISHIKCLGPDVWGKSVAVVDAIRRAQRDGVRVTADQYPYTASGSSLVASLLPQWAQAGGAEQILKRLNDESLRPRLMAEMEQNLKRRGGPDSLMFRSSRAPELVGKRLGDIARARKKPPVETAIELIREYATKGLGGLATVSFNMNEKDVEYFMKQDFVMTGSDGSAGHPRMYGTHAKKLREYVLGKKLMSLEDFVRRSSGMPAEVFGIRERGILREGYFADILVFDPRAVTDRATYENPEEFATGLSAVFLNGKEVVKEGKFTGTLAGRGLKKRNSAGKD